MKKHTKGPWKIGSPQNLGKIHPPHTKSNQVMVSIFGNDAQTENGHAIGPTSVCQITDGAEMPNAHLIAASPTLLEACEAALMSIELGPALGSPELAKKILQNAIDKAKGKGET